MEVLWLKNHREKDKIITKLAGISINIVTDYIRQYKNGGIKKLKETNL